MVVNIPGIQFTGKDEEKFVQDSLKLLDEVVEDATTEEYHAAIIWVLREIDPVRFKHGSDEVITGRFNKIANLYLPEEVFTFFESHELMDAQLNLTEKGLAILKRMAPYYKRTI